MSTIAFVPARGGSQSLPGKNLAEVGGRSLVARAVAVGLASPDVHEVVVSSNDDDILAAARTAGAAAQRRSKPLSTAEASTLDVVVDFLASRPDVTTIVVLQPTSPFRLPQDVERCLAQLASHQTVTTVTECDHPAEWTFTLAPEMGLRPLLGWDAIAPRRQEARTTYRLNGAVYAARADHLRAGGPLVGPDTAAVVMPRERSVDVDEEMDLVLARAVADWLEGQA